MPLWNVRKLVLPYRSVILMYGVFLLAMSLIAGIGSGNSGSDSAGLSLGIAWFSVTRALAIGLLLAKLFMVMLLGMPLLGLMSPYRLQQAIELMLTAVRVRPRTVRAVALTVALLFRFIPLIRAEWVRFARIAAARGKIPTLPGRLPLHKLHTVLIPFMLALLLTADRLAVTLEIRGFGRLNGKLVRAEPLKLTAHDLLFVLSACGLAAALWSLNRFL